MSHNSITSESASDSDSNSNSNDNYDDRDIDWSYEYINNYLLLNKLGQGAYCSVWLAYNIDTINFCALKIYSREDFDRGNDEILVYKELSKLNLDSILLYKNTFIYVDKNETNDNNKFVCAELQLCGYSIYDLIQIFNTNIPHTIIYNIILKVINILNNLHNSGYVHGDIKPENILIDIPTYTSYQIINLLKNKITLNKKIKNKNDFAQKVKEILENALIDDSEINIQKYIFNQKLNIILCDMGTTVKPNDPKLYKKYTIYYRAPETILNLNYSHTYDYWSLGCSLYEIITGEILFDADNDLELLHEFTSKLGPLPVSLMKQSKTSYLYYTKDCSRLRGYKNIKFNSIYQKLINLINKDNIEVIQKLINIIISCLNYDYTTRKIIL